MKKILFLLPLLAFGGAARADVAWEHRGTVKIGNSSPLVYFLLKNEWSGQKHRAAFTVDASKAFNAMAPSNSKPVRANVQMIENLADDRLILGSLDSKTFIDEPYKSLKGRLRLNFWEALGSDLSPTEVPQLTRAQRARLGQEIRAVVSPFTRKVMRTYFRALPEKRTINGLVSRGYRFTSMVNVATKKGSQEWVRANAEWWLADAQTGDDEIRAFTQSANQIKIDGGGPTASMWLNEQFPIIWEAAPVEMHQALASLIGDSAGANFGYQGTPVQFFLTVSPPPVAQMGIGGDFRFAVELTKRDTANVDTTLFNAPADAKRIEIEPFLGVARNFIKMGRGQLEKMLDQ
ncbi:MAG TPA: hypothetical protein VGB45_11170 [Abditibacterium sp.]|jgi:hypothetical protein